MDTPARFAVLDRCPGVAVRFEARPGGFLELVHHSADLRIARFVLRCPGDHARRVLVLELKPIGHSGHLVRMAPQHFDFFRVLLLLPVLILVLLLFGGEVLLAGEVVRRRRSRSGSASEKLDHHRGSPSTVKVSRRPLDGDQMRDHLQRLGVLLVGIRPAGDLVQVRPDPRQLPRAFPFQLGVRDRPGPHPAN